MRSELLRGDKEAGAKALLMGGRGLRPRGCPRTHRDNRRRPQTRDLAERNDAQPKQSKQKKELLLTHHLKIKNVNYIGDVTSPM